MAWKIRSRRTRSRATREAVTLATTPPCELDPRIGHVEVRGEHRDARGTHVDGLGAAGQVQDQVEVVDHEIEHDGDVGAARLEGGEALALEVERMVQQRLRGPQRLVEALDVPDLQLDALPRRLGDQLVGLAHGGGERLFHEHGHAAPQHLQTDLGVVRRGDGDGDGAHRPEQLVQVVEGPAAAGRRDLAGAGPVGVVHADEAWPRAMRPDGGRDDGQARPRR